MDSRIELANAISGLILSDTSNEKIIKARVQHFDVLLDDTIGNFYELKTNGKIPLFELYERLKLGSENYCLTEKEFDKENNKLVNLIQRKFGVSLRNQIEK